MSKSSNTNFQLTNNSLDLLQSSFFGGNNQAKEKSVVISVEKPKIADKISKSSEQCNHSKHYVDKQPQNGHSPEEVLPEPFFISNDDEIETGVKQNEPNEDLWQRLENAEDQKKESAVDDDNIHFDEEFEDDEANLPSFESNFLDSKGKNPIFEGSPATVAAFHTLALRFMTKNNLSKEGMTDFLNLLKEITPVHNNLVPANFLEMKKTLGFKNGDMQRMYHCGDDNCKNNIVYSKPGVCELCKKKLVSYMFLRKLPDLIKERFATNEFWTKCEWKRNGGTQVFMDITNSPEYKIKYEVFTSKCGCYTVIVMTDGGAAFKKSTHSLWPIFMVFCEIDPAIRYNPENVLFLGLNSIFDLFNSFDF